MLCCGFAANAVLAALWHKNTSSALPQNQRIHLDKFFMYNDSKINLRWDFADYNDSNSGQNRENHYYNEYHHGYVQSLEISAKFLRCRSSTDSLFCHRFRQWNKVLPAAIISNCQSNYSHILYPRPGYNCTEYVSVIVQNT